MVRRRHGALLTPSACSLERGIPPPGDTTMGRFLAALLRGILAMLSAPFRMLGFGPRVTASYLAAAALDGALDEAPSSAEPSYSLGDLIRAHAERRVYGAGPGAPELGTLPELVAAWLSGMDVPTLRRVHTTPSKLLEAHVLAGPDGQLKSLGVVVPRPDVPAPATMPAPRGIRGADLNSVLAELGYGPGGAQGPSALTPHGRPEPLSPPDPVRRVSL